MKKDTQSHITRKRVGELLAQYVGRGQQASYEDVARDAGVSTSLLYGLKNGDEDIGCSTDTLMDIVRVLPGEAGEVFIEETFGFFGVSRIDGVEGCHRKAQRSVTEYAATVARFDEDGVIDHREDAELRRRHVPKLMTVLARLAFRGARV